MRLVNWRALVIGAAGFGLAACGDDVTVTTPPISFTTSPSNGATCTAGTSTAVGVTVTGGSGTPTVNFSAQNNLITVTGNGTSATVVCGNTAGGSAVNFTITSGGQTVTGSIPVTISAGSGTNTGVTSISVNPSSASLVPGGSTTITASVTLAPGAPANTSTAVTFTSSDLTVATVTTNANGTATVTALPAAANVNKQVVITAASVANPNLRAFTTITISPTSALVQSLQVSPQSVNLSTGGTQQITSSVTLAAGAPAGTSTAVNYVSSDTSIVKVSSTGLITAGSRAGVATVTVSSVAAPSVVQQVGVTVTSPAPVRLTIQSLQAVNAAGNQVAIDPTNVAGRLIATLNLDPGSFAPDSVVATLGTQRVLCQRFTVQLVQALRASQTDGSADFAPIECILNTAAFDSLTGAARVNNGAQTFNATVYYRPVGGASSTTQTATVPAQLTLNNTSGFFVSVTNTPTATQVANSGNASGQAVGPNGQIWRAGSINVTVVPVLFNRTGTASDSLQSISVTLVDPNIIANVANFNNAPGGVTAPGARQANGTFLATFAGQSAAAPSTASSALPLSGLTSSPGGTQVQVGNVIGGNITGAPVFLNVNGVPLAGAPLANALSVYIDNQNPPVAGQGGIAANEIGFPIANLDLANTAFVNGAFSFSGSTVFANAASVAVTNNDFGGVDRVSRTFQFTTAPLAASPVYTTITTGADIPASSLSNAYILRVRFTDALGNAATLNSPTQFGVDLAAPTFTSITAPANQFQSNAAQSLTYNGLADNASGINVGTALLVSASRLAIANNTVGGTTAIVACPLTATQPDSSTTLTRVCPAVAAPNGVNFTQNGYYTVTSQARDRAGNLTATDSRQFVIDFVAPTLSVIGGPPALLTRGSAAAFPNFTAQDNLDLISTFGIVSYGNIQLAYQGPQLGTLFDNVLTTTANPIFTIPVFSAQVENPLGTVNAAQSFTGAVVDAGNNVGLSNAAAQPIGGNIAPTPASATFASRGVQAFNLNVGFAAGITQLSYGGATTTAATGRSASITVNVTGPSGTFANPMTSVELRYFDPTLTAYRVAAVLTLSNTVDNGVTRTYAYSGTYTPSFSQYIQGLTGSPVAQLIAVGFASNGDALISNSVGVQLVP